MSDDRRLIGPLSSFARVLVESGGIRDVLGDLARTATLVLLLAGAGVSLVIRERLHFAAAVDDRTTALGRAQEREQRGPGVDAWRRAEVVTEPDLARRPERWGEFGAEARRAGVAAVAGVPLLAGDRIIGTLELYADSPSDWPAEDLLAARLLADIAAAHLITSFEADRQRVSACQLQAALDSRVVIEQAKGMVAAQRGVSVQESFEILRRHARDRNATLRTVAEAVVARRFRP